MMTNKADYVLGICNCILLDGMWDKEELDIPPPSNNEASGLCIGCSDRWDVGRPLCYDLMKSKNNVLSLLVRIFSYACILYF